MELSRFVRDLKELGRPSVGRREELEREQQDNLELAVTARRFSQATAKVVDEKLTFSAALMRAGEIVEASRILAEVEQDVRVEEAALLERVNEVKVARAVRREHVTRMGLVRVLAAAVIGAGMLAFSAMGMALAGMFDGTPSQRARHFAERRDGGFDRRGHEVRRVKIGGVRVALAPRELSKLRDLTTGAVDAAVLERFLSKDLELPDRVVQDAIAGVLNKVEQLAQAVDTVAAQTETKVIDPLKKRVARASRTEAEPSAETEEPEKPAEEAPAEPEEPADDGTPDPKATEDPDDKDKKGDGDGEGQGDETDLPEIVRP